MKKGETKGKTESATINNMGEIDIPLDEAAKKLGNVEELGAFSTRWLLAQQMYKGTLLEVHKGVVLAEPTVKAVQTVPAKKTS